MFSFGRKIDFRYETRLADREGPRFPALRPPACRSGVVNGTIRIGGIAWIPNVPAGRGDHGERRAVDPFEEQRRMDGNVRLQRGLKIESAIANAAGGGGVRRFGVRRL